jgi:AcrR family transcriptional regulator
MTKRDGRTTRLTAAERREQLLDATKRLAAERGFHGVSIDAVARAAGISRPIVYDHFQDLDALLEALVARETARASAQLVPVLPAGVPAGDPRAVLRRALRAYLEAARDDPLTWRLVLMPPEGAPESLRRQITAGREAFVARLADAIRGGLGPGREPPDPELTARMLSAFADDAARLLLTQPERYDVERFVALAGWLLEQVAPGAPRDG